MGKLKKSKLSSHTVPMLTRGAAIDEHKRNSYGINFSPKYSQPDMTKEPPKNDSPADDTFGVRNPNKINIGLNHGENRFPPGSEMPKKKVKPWRKK